VEDIYKCLADDGIWHFEQSYMPLMLETNSYDTVCHEHLEFYSFKVIKDLLDKNKMKVISIQENLINGGSIAITASKINAQYDEDAQSISRILAYEKSLALDTINTYNDFATRVANHKTELMELLNRLVANGKTVFGYGASTKGNVLLQYCGITTKHLPFVAEVNEDKFGSYTPGTKIPIISEDAAKEMNPDYFLVLPWHFRDSILEKEKNFLRNGGKFIFPLPKIEIVGL